MSHSQLELVCYTALSAAKNLAKHELEQGK